MNLADNQIHVNLHYSARENQHRNFRLDVELELPGQGITAVFGESGSGKTTLLRCLAGLEKSAQGIVKMKTEIWQNEEAFLPTNLRHVGYVFQEPSLFPHLTIEKNIGFGLRRRGKTVDITAFNTIVELLDLRSLLDDYPHQLSGGERQRAAIARAILAEPQLLLMDEPLAALDINRKKEFLPYLEAIHERLEIPVIYVTHSMEEVARLADYLIIMEGGKAVAAGALADVLADVNLPPVFGEETGVVIEGNVSERDTDWHLIRANIDGGQLWVKDTGEALGEKIRIRILARDVSLALKNYSDTSIINRLKTTVVHMQVDSDAAMVIVTLSCGGDKLISRISKRSADLLRINVGKEVWAQIKGVAILR